MLHINSTLHGPHVMLCGTRHHPCFTRLEMTLVNFNYTDMGYSTQSLCLHNYLEDDYFVLDYIAFNILHKFLQSSFVCLCVFYNGFYFNKKLTMYAQTHKKSDQVWNKSNKVKDYSSQENV